MQATADKRLVRTDGAAELLGLSRSTLEKMRVHGGGPRYVQLGARAIGYWVGDLIAWAESRPTMTSTSEPPSAA